jgi:hypothetical protein
MHICVVKKQENFIKQCTKGHNILELETNMGGNTYGLKGCS